MKLVLLGTTGYHPSDRRQTACLMIPEQGVILDAGAGMYRARDYLQTPELDIFITHAHLDHVVGITYLFDILFERNVDRVTVHGRADHLEAIDEHLLATPLFPVKPPCALKPFDAAEVPLRGGGALRHFPVEHPGGAVGMRLDWPGHSMAYVTDTTASPDAPYVAELQGVDLLIHECYFPDAMSQWAAKTGHSSTSNVAQVAKAAGVSRLVLVHMNPLGDDDDPIGLATAQAIFPGTRLGEDRLELEF